MELALLGVDEYAKGLSRSIHLNPVRAEPVETPAGYEWSSCRFFIGAKKPPHWLYRDFILGHFGDEASTAQKRYRSFVNAIANEAHGNPLNEVVSSTLLGSPEFIAFIKDNFLSNQKPDKKLPALNELVEKIPNR
ncbi:MAG: hypothetical protein P8Y40_08685 [Desulfobacterales bacterium]|jgi:putative transposase